MSVCPFDFKVLDDWFHSWLLWDKPHWDEKSDETKSGEMKSSVRQKVGESFLWRDQLNGLQNFMSCLQDIPELFTQYISFW